MNPEDVNSFIKSLGKKVTALAIGLVSLEIEYSSN